MGKSIEKTIYRGENWMNGENDLRAMGYRAKQARRTLATLLSTEKNRILHAVADALEDPSRQNTILEANKQDIADAEHAGISQAMIERKPASVRLSRRMARSISCAQRASCALVGMR